MLHLVQSNRMESLANHLAAWIANHPPCSDNPFEPTTVLVQSPGMATWLHIAIGERLGIAANIECPLPSSYIWQLYKEAMADLPEQSAFTKPNMTWKLMAILPTLLDQPVFAPVADYLADEQPLKRYQLCHKIADVFDQYLVYRPDWISAWEQHQQVPADIGQHAWQPELWRHLVDYTASLGEAPWHRANLHQALLQALTGTPEQNAQRPLYVFGISAMPRQQLEILNVLSAHREVVIFWLNPSAEYWADIVDPSTLTAAQLAEKEEADYLDVGNPLLAGWGKLGREFLDMLLDLDIQQHDSFEPPEANTMLGCLHRDVYQLTHRGSTSPLSAEELLSDGIAYPKFAVAEGDRSISVHACHSKVRELEILHDHLLHLFRADPTLTPGDIVVMMPDIAAYAPYIDGVFGHTDAGLYIPYALSDRRATEASPVIAGFLQVLQLHHQRLTLTDVMAMLDIESVQRKFDIDSQEYDVIRYWLNDAGVRWGWDGADKGRWSVPQDNTNSWLFGLQRLLAGYAMHGEQLWQHNDEVIAPYEHLEGQHAVALGKCWLFLRVIRDALDFCCQSATLSEKVQGALTLVDALYDEQEDNQQPLQQLRQAIESCQQHEAQFPGTVDQDVFVAELSARLDESGVGQRFLAGYVNFCTLMPMRSVPFRHVCILGLDEGQYPRQSVTLGFDLMRQHPRQRGDRSRRMDDRYLFLEAVLSARDSLYLSYIGMSEKDNAELGASVLVAELLEYCQQTFRLEHSTEHSSEDSVSALTDHLCTSHALQPFHPRYFEPGSPLQSFQSRWLTALATERIEAQPFNAQPLSPLYLEQDTSVTLEELQRFFANPARGFFRQRWHVSLAVDKDASHDLEAFTLDGLSRYQLVESLLHPGMEKQQQAQRLRLQAEGRLPLGSMQTLSYQRVSDVAHTLTQAIEPFVAGQERRRLRLNLELPNGRIDGVVDDVYGGRLVLHRPGAIRGRDRFSLYLAWLCVCATPGQWQEAVHVGLDKGKAVTCRLGPVSADDAQARLASLVGLWQEGLAQALMFFPDSAWVWVSSGNRELTLNSFAGSAFARGEGQDVHVARVCPSLDEQWVSFTRLAEQIMGPLKALEARDQ
ncbi:exodeoxyribonuclease V subunit gamma [Aestuariibacter halophilus]|uniref:RecBCD enzyme subunit RecC n=1 Tax=Fluctibacter halophilus TaxID=226011 RepID=A0ABS8G842_9ALTE|nr:exodeoxyribonuclease V subunit gamma [Aestuariibacter halophilus]MCC2615864.1 exodeoxyribonuclease V subunit gamma [Aestuariibacter halophilus]